MTDVRILLGQSIDQEFVDMGASYRQLRYLGRNGNLLATPITITPNPLIWHDGLVEYDELVGPNQEKEYINTYRVSLPKETFSTLLETNTESALRHFAFWEILDTDVKADWIPLRAMGKAESHLVRWNLTLIEVGGPGSS